MIVYIPFNKYQYVLGIACGKHEIFLWEQKDWLSVVYRPAHEILSPNPSLHRLCLDDDIIYYF